MLRAYDKDCDRSMPHMHVVFGAYDGPIDAKPGEKVVFIGDCAKWQGKLPGSDKLVKIDSLYRDRSTKDPYNAEADDIYLKLKNVTQKVHAARKDQVVRLQGCPVSVAEQLLALVSLGGIKNPYLDPAEAMRFNNAYMGWKAAVAFRRLKGEKYQVKGAAAARQRDARGGRREGAAERGRGRGVGRLAIGGDRLPIATHRLPIDEPLGGPAALRPHDRRATEGDGEARAFRSSNIGSRWCVIACRSSTFRRRSRPLTARRSTTRTRPHDDIASEPRLVRPRGLRLDGVTCGSRSTPHAAADCVDAIEREGRRRTRAAER